MSNIISYSILGLFCLLALIVFIFLIKDGIYIIREIISRKKSGLKWK